jgi:hypothetical protein
MTIRQTGFLKDTIGTYIVKDATAELQYGMDWKEWLELGDTITTSTWAVETTGTTIALVASSGGTLDGVALANVTGGTVGEIYTVRNTIQTAQGYKDARRFRIRVENRFVQ